MKNGKRDESNNWSIRQEKVGDDDIFSVDIQAAKVFENEIHHVKCGVDNYTGDTIRNEKGCHRFLNGVVGHITGKIKKSHQNANKAPTQMAKYVSKRFSTYTMWTNVERLTKTTKAEDKLFNNLKNSLVTKGYSDGNCFVRCGTGGSFYDTGLGPISRHEKSLACQTVCYDPIKDRYERLYGFGSEKPAELSPWSLNEQVINDVSYRAYQDNFRPGIVNLNPYVPVIQDEAPILPVCVSELEYNKNGLVCSCGNKYGDMTEFFANSINLRSAYGNKQSEWKAIRSCLDRIKPYAYHQPAVYLLNACHVIYTIVTPPGTGSVQESHDLGHYGHNLRGCRIYWDFYRRNTHLSDAQLDDEMCKLWAQNAKDFDRGPNHKHPDFSYVNDLLEDKACDSYKRR
ncbi:hypothetical protein P153DRAFT_369746 [Dothidotthia symphoricarpi CBS 119687]|uniref:Uncharacterized protein n=1 Tax=Dothidotthia symphoricarpi CBS 119687 TaxID=1392245 RepID=A0A6A6A1N0_9PLEO|nr:uncharacterized protein P153DRAFT_369746 [Dothidotthia symphoricarpi CBS 119687]KAF2125749.1 hypothetical protein P153DRAFT_369746 [Dothidotthia symphoricarpi CBS 119687]